MAEGAAATGAVAETTAADYSASLFDGAPALGEMNMPTAGTEVGEMMPAEMNSEPSLIDQSKAFLSDAWQKGTSEYRDSNGEWSAEKTASNLTSEALSGSGASKAQQAGNAPDMSQFGNQQAKQFLAQAPQAPDAASELQKLRSMIQ